LLAAMVNREWRKLARNKVLKVFVVVVATETEVRSRS
jgi:hypothetical protein